MLSIEELTELEEKIQEALPEKLTEALAKANRMGELEELLRLLNCSDLLGSTFETFKEGKIALIGATEVKKDVFLAIGKKLGVDKKRFVFCLDYKEIKTYNFKKMQFNPDYRVILFGPGPHSGHGKGDSRSIVAELENTFGYPRVERLRNGDELKITKSNFEKKLRELVDEGYI